MKLKRSLMKDKDLISVHNITASDILVKEGARVSAAMVWSHKIDPITGPNGWAMGVFILRVVR